MSSPVHNVHFATPINIQSRTLRPPSRPTPLGPLMGALGRTRAQKGAPQATPALEGRDRKRLKNASLCACALHESLRNGNDCHRARCENVRRVRREGPQSLKSGLAAAARTVRAGGRIAAIVLYGEGDQRGNEQERAEYRANQPQGAQAATA